MQWEASVMDVSFRNEPDKALAWYHRNGYFVEKGVFSQAECDKLIAAAHQLPAARAGDYRPAMQPHRHDPLFLEAMRHERVLTVIEALVGGVPNGLQTEFFYSKPSVRGFAAHQDNFFVEADEDTFASAWVALVDVGPENGGLIGFPGSHKEGRLPVRKLDIGPVDGQDPNANNDETILPARYERVNIIAPKGSVVFLHAHFAHGSNVNASKDFRYALLCTYIREGAYFRPGRYAQRSASKLR